MEDCDWTDLPSTSGSAVFGIDDNYITDSSPEITEKNEDLPAHENEKYDIANTENDELDYDVNVTDVTKPASNKQQEKESCPICLSSFEDRSFLDQCFHSFCFCCILQWCEVVQTCPLCKAGFVSVIHNVKSMQDYEQYIVEKKKESEQAENNARVESYNERGFNEHGHRFRYRTTRSLRNNSENNNARSETQHSEITASRQSRSEGWGNEATTRRRSRHTRTRIRGIEKRRQVYAFNLRATSSLGRGKQRSRNVSCQFYKTYQGCTHRLIPWLARDLRVLLGNNEEEVNFLMEFILSLITRIDMDSPEFVEEMRPFLLQTTEHFVHELLSFAKAPLDMAAYGECVVYPWPEESFRATNPRDEDNVNEEREDHSLHVVSTQPVPESTSLSRCAWSDTPARLHQVLRVQDSPMQSGESLRPVEVHQVIEISDSTESPERMSDETRKQTEHSQDNEGSILHSENSVLGQSSPVECQSSLTHESLSEAVRRDSSTEREELPTSKKHKEDGAEHVHRHIHKHVHKHKYKHKHKHKHSHKHKHKHRHKHKHKGLHFNPESNCTSEDASSAMDISATQIRPFRSEIETISVGQAHSPKLEDMRKEIDELNVLIQQHEEQLLSLSRRTES